MINRTLWMTSKLGIVVLLAGGPTARGLDFNLLASPGNGSSAMELRAGGITATLSTNGGTFNLGDGQFGISSATDIAETRSIVNGAEQVHIVFDADVVWDSFAVSVQSDAGCSVIVIAEFGGQLFCGSGLQNSGAGLDIPAGGVVRLFASDSEGFSLDSFSVTAVGEGGGGGGEGGGTDGEGGDGEVETPGDPGSTDPILRVVHTGRGNGHVWAEYFDNAREFSVYLGEFDTLAGTFSFEAELPLGEGVYLYESTGDACSLFNGFSLADGTRFTEDPEAGRYGPIRIDQDTTIYGDFEIDLLVCGPCPSPGFALMLAGLHFMPRRPRKPAAGGRHDPAA